MTTCTVIVQNEYGIHLRPSGMIVLEAKKFASAIRIANEEGTEASTTSALSLLGLGLHCGSKATIICEGEDEQEASLAIAKLVGGHFEFTRKNDD